MLTKAEVQRLRSLRDKKAREALGLFVIEGEKVVGELLAENFPLLEIYATRAWIDRAADVTPPISPHRGARHPAPARATAPALHVREISVADMTRASHYPTPSSVLAVGQIFRPALPSDALERGLTLALDGVQDAGNVGTLLRIADWFAFDRVVLSPDCADLFHQKVINASMGSFARLPAHTADLAPVLAATAERSPATWILGCDLDGEDVHALPALRDAVVVIGSEGRGLSPPVAACITHRVTIPRYGAAESLNAAIAAAIVCDNLRRQNHSGGSTAAGRV